MSTLQIFHSMGCRTYLRHHGNQMHRQAQTFASWMISQQLRLSVNRSSLEKMVYNCFRVTLIPNLDLDYLCWWCFKGQKLHIFTVAQPFLKLQIVFCQFMMDSIYWKVAWSRFYCLTLSLVAFLNHQFGQT